MPAFFNIKELLLTLSREEKLLTEMFQKRKSVSYKWEYALELVGGDERRIRFLIDHSVIRENGAFLEIDDTYLQFFEQILEVNEEINTSYINENIQKVRENITYFFNDKNERRKNDYLRIVKRTLRRMGQITLRNIIDLKRNVDNTFKNEPDYKNKQAKLKNLDQKRKDVSVLITQIEYLINEGEITFFKTTTDEEMEDIIIQLKKNLQKCTHNLIEIEKQIIEFLNQISQQGRLVEQLRRVKYLKDQFILETETDFKNLMSEQNLLVYEPFAGYSLRLSLDELQASNYAFDIIKKIAKEQQSGVKLLRPVATEISQEYLSTQIEEQVLINPEEVKNSFLAGGNNLFDFITNYHFAKEVSFADQITLYCQLVSQYEDFFRITDDALEENDFKIAMVYPK